MGTGPHVFISYSHDSQAHRDRVLALSERLRQDGIETLLDRYVNGTPAQGWPRWMLDGLDQASRVLLICTPTYYRRFRGHEAPGKGKGVDWEGAVITQEIYEARSATTRFVPVLFDADDESQVPEPVRGQSRYSLTDEAAYQALYDALLDQAGVEPGPVGEPKRRPRPSAAPLSFTPEPQAAKIDLTHLPSGAEHFLGRAPELLALNAAWADGGAPRVSVVELIAPGGTGKTALVKRWVESLKVAEWDGAGRVFGWSFYSQGTGDDRQASEDLFLAKALDWFGVEIAPAAHPADKGRALGEAVAARRTLLVLDGCEPLQHPPGPLAGELRAPGLKALLTHLASAGQPGLCVLTSRERLQDLAEWVRGPGHPSGPVLRLDLGNLSEADGARLLHTLGADRAGVAGIGPEDPELLAASREVRGHALTLSLLGRYLTLAEGGDIRRRDRVDLAAASEAIGGHAFRVMAAYETWFARAGQAGARELSVLRLLGFFDRPASAEDLAALRAAPPIPGLTEALFTRPGGWFGFLRRPEPIPERDWAIALKRLGQAGLVAQARVDGGAELRASGQTDGPGRDARAPLDAHPLVREYLAAALKEANPEAFREGHRRLYERLKTSAPHRPEGLAGLQPLYQAVAHGCLAGLWQEVLYQVYRDRILRGTGPDGFYSTKKLGAFGADLGACACLFAEPWTRPAPALSEPAQAWLLNEAAFRLRALGRLTEALGPMRAGAEMRVKQQVWNSAARIYGNLSELQLTLGLVPEAVADAQSSVDHADRSGDAFERLSTRTTLADALHQQGETGEARKGFAEAEAIKAEFQPAYPLLYSLQGFRYCDLLLAGAEGAAWAAAGGVGGAGDPGAAGACEAVAGRARQALKIAEKGNAPLLTIALDHLTLARCALYADLLAGRRPGPQAQAQTRQALDGLRAAGQQDYIPRGLLTRAWLRQAQGDTRGAQADLAEAEHIASRSGMALFLADIALHRARLFRDPQALAEARRLIEAHGYRRRLPELADAETAAALWEPDPAATTNATGTTPTDAGGVGRISEAHPPTGPEPSNITIDPEPEELGCEREAREQRAYALALRQWERVQDLAYDREKVVEPVRRIQRHEPKTLSAALEQENQRERLQRQLEEIDGKRDALVQELTGDEPMTTTAGPDPPTDFLLVAPMPEERDALLARLPGYRKLPPSEDDIRVYYAAEIPARFPDGRPVTYSAVVLPLARMGHTEAASATSDAIRRFRPRYVLLVGIAGGIAAAGVGLGDVLLSDQVADYELAKVTPAGPSIRWQVHQVDQRLLIAAQNHDGGTFADTATPRPAPGQPRVHIGPICTGNKVIADDSLATQLREVWVKLIGVEMEAGGVANAASQSARRPGFFMVRGVSDLADADKDSAEVKHWRAYACEIAAAWTLDWLKSGPVPAGAPVPAPQRDRPSTPTPGKPDSAQAKQSTPAPGRAPAPSALAIWKEKLDYLRAQEAICSDPAQRFTLKKQIEEAEAKLRELS